MAAKTIAFPAGSTPDGVAMDELGRVYTALNVRGKIARYDPGAGGDFEVVAEEVGNPASLAFGRREFGSCWLYATHLLDKVVMRVSIQ